MFHDNNPCKHNISVTGFIVLSLCKYHCKSVPGHLKNAGKCRLASFVSPQCRIPLFDVIAVDSYLCKHVIAGVLSGD